MKTRALLFLIMVAGAGICLGQTYPFPQNKIYSYGLMPGNRSASDASSAYNTWKTNFLSACSNGRYRVKFDDPSQTVSEGIGYGMLLSAYAGERSVFDGLWLYYKDNRNGNGVMNWKIAGCSGTVGANGATDADEDAAMALIVAHYQWGSAGSINYQSDANALIAAIKSKEVEGGSNVLKPGDAFGGSSNTNPSYFAPGYYRIFGTFTGDATFWNNVAAQCYTIINNNLSAHNAAGGLVSDWCQANGAYSQGQNYSYDAARTPWRIAVDYAWYGTASAKTYVKKSSDFVRINLGGSQNVKDGYSQSGSAIGQWHNSTFVGGFASAAMGGDFQAHLDNSYSDLRGINDAGSYFNQTLKTLYLFLLTGNFYLPGGTSTPPPPTPTLSPYGGTAAAIPGRIEAEKFDNGGSGIAYNDADAVNSGGQFRTEGVDIEATTDAGAGYNVGYTAAGEWLKYSVNVSAAGKYDFKVRVASISAGKSFHIEMNGVNVTGAIVVPNTGGWQSWQTVTISGITLSAGAQVMRVYMDTDGFNLNYVDVAASAATPPPNVAPSVSITSPANNASFVAGSTINVTANATDSDGSISKVEFFQGTMLLGTSTTSPYSFSWTNVAAGSYSLSAKATDNSGAVTTSATVAVTVTATPPPANVAPNVSITSPANNASFTSGSNIAISASATDSDGNVARVEFFQGTALLGTSTASPYSFTWTNVAAGTYSLTARATDNAGATKTSAAVSVTVTDPTPPPTGGACTTEAIPNAADYIVRNDWTDYNNGSSVSAATGAMKITHRQWGENLLWLIEASKSFNISSGKTYTIQFDFLNDAANPVTAVNVGLASNYDWAGPVLTQPVVTAPAGYSSSSYTTKTVTITATSSQTVRLALKLNWAGQPNLAVNTYIKNVSICESGAARFGTSSGSAAVNANAVFPNPFEGQTNMQISTSEDMPLSVKIMDISGTIIFQSDKYSTNENISLGDGLNPGMYLLQVNYGDQVNVYKLMKD